MYWIIKDGNIELIRQLPRTMWNISLPENPTNEQLKTIDIYPVVWNSQPLEEWQTYWNPTYELVDDEIIETKEAVDEPLEEYKTKKTKQMSDKCKADILAKHSEIDQLNNIREFARLQDVYNATGEINKEKVAELRAIDKWIEDRRAEYHTQKEAIQSFATYQEIQDYVNSLYPNTEKLWA